MKVAQDLGALFGSQANENKNSSHMSEHDHNHANDDENHTSAPSTSTAKNLQSLQSKQVVAEVKEKGIDWSQYFGIDRRRKKAVLAARPGTQNQDDAFFLQRYYRVIFVSV